MFTAAQAQIAGLSGVQHASLSDEVAGHFNG